jgi:hypothetical protein
MSDNRQVDDLLKKGIEAAKGKDTATARALLEQVVQMDQHNEKAWFWLAAVTDEIEEKRICLGNVLVINPNNSRAQKLLRQLEKEGAAGDTGDDDFGLDTPHSPTRRSGGGRRPLLILVFVLVIVIALGAIFVLMSGGDGSADNGANSGDTNSNSSTKVAGGSAPSNNVLSSATPIPSITPTGLVPTWTPQPTITSTPDIPPTLFPPPPSTLGGRIIMQSGRVTGDRTNQPIVLIQPDGAVQLSLTNETRGHAPALSSDGTEYVFIEYGRGTGEELLRINNIQGSNPRLASDYWGYALTFSDMNSPVWSPDGFWLAFTARGAGASQPNLYRVSLLNPLGDTSALEQLTNDDAIESWPTYSPDGTQIAYVADLQEIEVFDKPVDLRVVDLTTGIITDLTTNGSDLVESAPDWSPSGSQIVFQGMERDGTDWDIYAMPATGLGEPEKIIDSDADDIRPRYSPDGRYIVFTSNRSGNWDVFVYNLQTKEMYQITNTSYDDIANDWSN